MDGDDKPTSVSDKDGYQITRFNALRHGVLSKDPVLPWEDRAEYEKLLEALVAEYKPKGPTEEHLVKYLGGVFWRNRRLAQAERAVYFRALQRTTRPDQFPTTSKSALVLVTAEFEGRVRAEAVSTTDEQHAAALAVLEEDEARAQKALTILAAKIKNYYRGALLSLNGEQREFWFIYFRRHIDSRIHDKSNDINDADVLEKFIKTEILPRNRDRRYALEHRLLIREQSFGEAVDISRLEGLARYEVHLDRKMERVLGMLLKLQSLRRDISPD